MDSTQSGAPTVNLSPRQVGSGDPAFCGCPETGRDWEAEKTQRLSSKVPRPRLGDCRGKGEPGQGEGGARGQCWAEVVAERGRKSSQEPQMNPPWSPAEAQASDWAACFAHLPVCWRPESMDSRHPPLSEEPQSSHSYDPVSSTVSLPPPPQPTSGFIPPNL